MSAPQAESMVPILSDEDEVRISEKEEGRTA